MQQLRRESRDPAQRDKVEDFQLAADYWYTSRNLKNLPDMDAALAEVLPYALKLSPEVTDYQTWEQAHEFKSYHDAGAILLAKCYTLLYYGRDLEARESMDIIDTKLRYSLKLERDRTAVWVRRNLRYHEHFCALYRMLLHKKVELCQFPMERDEFDGEAQRMALEDMVRLRILDGSAGQMAEYLLHAARRVNLRRQNGQSVLGGFYEAVTPHSREVERESAWTEMRNGIERWREKVPTSVSARIAEACFWIEYAIHLNEKSDAPPPNKQLAWDQRLDKARRVLDDTARDCPGWYAAKIRLLDCLSAPLDDVSAIFQEAKGKFPDYEPIHLALCEYLRTAKDLGLPACAGVIEQLAAQGQSRIAAHCLQKLVWKGEADRLIGLLDVAALSRIIPDAVANNPLSLKWRSDLAYVALRLGQHQPAEWCLRGMKDRWDRGTWKMHLDIVRIMATAGPLEPAPKAVKPASS